MSLAAVQTEILEPMQALFLPPRDMDATAQTTALRAYGAALEHFDAPDLRNAWREVVCEYRTRAWPVPGVIVSAARKAYRDRTGADAVRKRGGIDWHARHQHWEWVRTSQLAADAVEAGVSWSLKCAVLDDGKPHGAIHLGALIHAHESAEDTARAIGERAPIRHRGRTLRFDEYQRDVALKMWTNLLCREDATAQEIRDARSTSAAPPARGGRHERA